MYEKGTLVYQGLDGNWQTSSYSPILIQRLNQKSRSCLAILKENEINKISNASSRRSCISPKCISPDAVSISIVLQIYQHQSNNTTHYTLRVLVQVFY